MKGNERRGRREQKKVMREKEKERERGREGNKRVTRINDE